MTNPPKRILLGEIVSVHGIRGDVVIRSHAASPQAFERYGPLTDTQGVRTFLVRVVRDGPKGVVGHIEGVDDRTAAEALRGTQLYADRARLPAPDAGEFYHADLVGLAAIDANGGEIGMITAVHNYGAGDFLEIARGDEGASELVPFTDAYVPIVDVEAGRVTVLIPDSADQDDEGG